LTLGSLAFLAPGLTFLVRPNLLALGGVQAMGPDGATEIRALYGGLEVAIALALLRCALREDLWLAGLTLQTVLFAGLASGRLVGIAAARGASGVNLFLLCLELAGVAVSAAVRWRAATREA
jgi:hypothetical protein